MASSTYAQTGNSVDFLKDFRKLSALPTENRAKSTIQLSKDGLTVIHTRRHSKLARIFAHVFTKLSSKDFFDSYGIANKHRQQQAVDKFFNMMVEKYDYQNTRAELQSLSLAEMDELLQESGAMSGANSLRELFSISNYDPGKIASGQIADNLARFARIDNYNELSEEQQLALKQVHDGWQTNIKEELEMQGFSSDEVGYVLASMIEEAQPLLHAILKKPSKATDYLEESKKLADKLAAFIGEHSKIDGNIEETADATMKLMLDFSNFANVSSNIDMREEWPHNFAKYALFPVIQAASAVRDDETASANIATGGGTSLAALVGQYYFVKPNIPRTISIDPLYSRCASFEPIKAALNMNGLMRGADNNCKAKVSRGKINLNNVWDACTRTISDTVNEHGYRQFITDSTLPNYIMLDLEENKFHQASIEHFSGLNWGEMTEDQKERALDICKDLKSFVRSLYDWGTLSNSTSLPFDKYFQSMRPLIAEFITNEEFADQYKQNAEILKENAKNLAEKCLGQANSKAFSAIATDQTKMIQPLMYLSKSLGMDNEIDQLSDLIAFMAARSLGKDDLVQMRKAAENENSQLSSYLLYSRVAQTFIADDDRMTPAKLSIDADSFQEALTKSITQKIALFAVAIDSQFRDNNINFNNLEKFQEGKAWLSTRPLTDAEKKYYEDKHHSSLDLFTRYGKAINNSIIKELHSP